MSEAKTVTFELNEGGVEVAAQGIAVVQGLDSGGELALEVTNLGDVDDVTALGMIEAAAVTYRERVRRQFLEDE